MNATHIPDPFLSISSCLSSVGPWSSWRSRLIEKLAEFDLPSGRLEAYTSWGRTMEEAGSLLPLDVCADLGTARDFTDRFCTHLSDVVICGLGLPRFLVDDLLRDIDHPESGLAIMASRQSPLASGGVTLGYEPLGLEYGGHFHSWTCNALQSDALAFAQTTVTQGGFIEDLEAASRVVAFIDDDDESGAEPVPWYPILLVRY
jgi:hypothetical protein